MATSATAKQRSRNQVRNRDLRPVEIERIKQMRQTGSSLVLIARTMNLSVERIEFVLQGASPSLDLLSAFSQDWHRKYGVQILRGQVEGIPGPLRIGTDASLAGPLASFGFVDTLGNWAVYAFEAEQRTTTSNLEMAAIGASLHGLSMHDSPLIFTDSMGSMLTFTSWQQGRGKEPKADAVLAPVLTRVHRGVHGSSKRWHGVQVEHVRGHSGHLLNEAADAMAKLGRRSLLQAQLGEVEATERANSLVASFLDSVREQD